MPDLTWPTVEEVQNLFVAAGLITLPVSGPSAAIDWQDIIDGVVGEWEGAAGWRPFLAPAEPTTREFATPDLFQTTADPWGQPQRVLHLPTGIVAASEVRLFLPTIYGAVSTEGDGILLNEGSDYRLLPVGAEAEGSPYTSIAFTLGHYWAGAGGESGILRVTGRFGYCGSLPAEVKRLAKELAACEAAPYVHSARFAAAGGQLGMKQKVEIGPTVVEIGATSAAAGASSPVLYGDEAQKLRLKRKFFGLAEDYRRPVFC